MIYIRTILAIYIISLLGKLGKEDSDFIDWVYYELKLFNYYSECVAFTRACCWWSIFLFVASCIFFK